MFPPVHCALIVFSHLKIKSQVKYLILDKAEHLEIASVPSCLDKYCTGLVPLLVVIDRTAVPHCYYGLHQCCQEKGTLAFWQLFFARL